MVAVANPIHIDRQSTSDSRSRTATSDSQARQYYASLFARGAEAPRRVLLNVDGGNVRGRQWVPARVEYEADEFIVTDLVTERFGTGESIAEAKQDCVEIILDYIDALRDAQGRMSWLMEEHLRAIREYVDLV